MEIRDIFTLRKQGEQKRLRSHSPYVCGPQRALYHHCHVLGRGRHDELRYQQRQLEEAYKIFRSLLRLYPTMDDKDLKGQSTLMRAALLVFEHHPGFSMLDFITQWGITRLTDDEWRMEQGNGHPIPSIGMRIVGKVFKEVESKPTVDMALKAAPILAEALKHSPYNMHNQRYKAMIYRIDGKKDKAINIYTHLIKNHRQSYLFHELSELIDDERYKIALLCKAIAVQREEKFRQRMRFTLAGLLFRRDKARARYELDKCNCYAQAVRLFHHMGDAEPCCKSGRYSTSIRS